MLKSFDYKVWLVAIFIILYGLYIFFVDVTIEAYAEMIAATVFFFALFAGFFIARQNERFNDIDETISKENALCCYLYRTSGLITEIQDRIREIIMKHYQNIKKSGNWAYHTENPSTTITDLTEAFADLDKEEYLEKTEKPAMANAIEIIWDAMKDLQLTRKRIVVLKKQKMLPFQWWLIYLLGFLLIASFNFIPNAEGALYIDLLKILFGTTVFMVIILLKQLNDLTIFGRKYTEKGADDVFWVIEEKDKEELSILPEELKKKIKATKEKLGRL